MVDQIPTRHFERVLIFIRYTTKYDNYYSFYSLIRVVVYTSIAILQ